jgi:hypothetical protein
METRQTPQNLPQIKRFSASDVAAVMRRLRDGPQFSPDPVLRRMESAVHAVIEAKGVIRHDEPAFKTLYWERRRRGMATERLGDEVNDSHTISAETMSSPSWSCSGWRPDWRSSAARR